MPWVRNLSGMDRLALCGWTDEAPRLLHALKLRARLEPIAVGDRQAVQLVRARAATGLACYQHVLEMLRSVDLDAVAITSADAAEELAETAAARGADLVLWGDAMSAAALDAAVEAARRHRVALAVLRPRLQSAGLAFLIGLATADASWRPRFMSIDVAGPGPVSAQLRTAVALSARLLEDLPAAVIGSVVDGSVDDGFALAAQLRGRDGTVGTLTARTERAPSVRLVFQAPAGTAELTTAAEGRSTLTLTAHGGTAEQSELNDTDLLGREVDRVAAIRRGDAQELLTADRETRILRAAEAALATGAITIIDESTRPELRLLDGGARECAPRRGHLRLLGA